MSEVHVLVSRRGRDTHNSAFIVDALFIDALFISSTIINFD